MLVKKGILYGAGSFNCKNCFVPVHQKCANNAKLEKDWRLFCSSECSIGEKGTYDKDGHFIDISNNVFKVAFDFRDVSIVFLQSSNSTVITMKPSILFNILSSNDDGKGLIVNKIIFSETLLTDDKIKNLFKTKDENYIYVIFSQVVWQFESSPTNIMNENVVQITNNIYTVQYSDSKHNNKVTKKVLITSKKNHRWVHPTYLEYRISSCNQM